MSSLYGEAWSRVGVWKPKNLLRKAPSFPFYSSKGKGELLQRRKKKRGVQMARSSACSMLSIRFTVSSRRCFFIVGVVGVMMLDYVPQCSLWMRLSWHGAGRVSPLD